MNDSGPLPSADELAGHRNETVEPTGDVTRLLKAAQPEADAGPSSSVLTAEWALWGKDEQQTAYHVLRCSTGALTGDDFTEIITRYGLGVKPDLPQYTVCWIPGPQGRPEHVAVGIHELADADPQHSGGRSRHVGGRVVEYVRLFCIRYADLAELAPTYTELVAAVKDYLLPPGLAKPLRIELQSAEQAAPGRGPHPELAAEVAVLLLTGRPVCILNADQIPAATRLEFIDGVLALLPYGLRATLSASTWASSTAQDLKFRLFFASAPREDGGRTIHLRWDKGRQTRIERGRYEAAEVYRDWLASAGPGAIAGLASMGAPVRFAEDEIRERITFLPSDKSVAETLAELDESIRAANWPVVSEQVRRLKRFIATALQKPADRAVYRSLIVRYGLFADHEKLHASTKKSLYNTLLQLAYDQSLSYADYCEIEDSVGGRPGWTLRTVLLNTRLNVLGYVLAAQAGPGSSYEGLAEQLDWQDWRAGNLLAILEREIDLVRPRHRETLIDFTMYYLTARAEDSPRVLAAHGYLSGLLERAFPGDQRMQQGRLEAVLEFVYGSELSKSQIVEVFGQPRLAPTKALEAAVAKLAPAKARRFIAETASYARLSQAGYAQDAAMLRGSRVAGRPRLPREVAGPVIPNGTKIAIGIVLTLAIIAVLLVWLRMSRG